MKGLGACFNSPCTRCLSAALGAALATAHGILEHRITKAALPILAFVASLYARSPARGIALFLGAFIARVACSRVLAYFLKVRPQEPEKSTTLAVSLKIGETLSKIAGNLRATARLDRVEDCTKFNFQPQGGSTPCRLQGIDELGQTFYAFQFYYLPVRKGETLSMQEARTPQWTGIEVIYKKTDGPWMSYSTNPTFFRANKPVDPRAIEALEKMADPGKGVQVSSVNDPSSATQCFLHPLKIYSEVSYVN